MRERHSPSLLAFEGVDGCGKSTLLRRCGAVLGSRERVLETKLAYELVAVFQSLIDRPSGNEGAYQDVLPPDFRHSVYIVEALVQMRYRRTVYAEYDVVLFDRWLHTHRVYLEPPVVHSEWYGLLEDQIPKPSLTIYLRVDPTLALMRLIEKDDWMVSKWGSKRLLAHLERLAKRYDELFADDESALVVDGAASPDVLIDVVIGRLDELRANSRSR